jgi:hypothetical protein
LEINHHKPKPEEKELTTYNSLQSALPMAAGKNLAALFYLYDLFCEFLE